LIKHKRGDTFDQLFVIPDIFIDGYFAPWTVTAQIRTAKYGTLISELTCTWVDPLTTRLLKIQDFETNDWFVGSAELDVQFYNPVTTYTLSTDTLSVEIVKDITRVEVV